MRLLTKSILIFLICGMANAANFDRCFNVASIKYQIPGKLLKAIAKTETKMNPYAININSNHTYDIGIMQINSSWLPKLNRVGIFQKDLLEPCENIQIGAWILAQNIKRYGFTGTAIGAYNSSQSASRERYMELVMSNLK